MIEGEINNFIMVWSVATILFCYSYTIGKLIPKGKVRFVTLIPPIIILLLLPMRLTIVHLVGPSSFLLSWLSTFKLFLFAFSKGPLSSNPPLSLSHFLLIASFPIKLANHANQTKIKVVPINCPSKLVIIFLFSYFFIHLYDKKENFHPINLMILYTLHLYAGLEIFLVLISTLSSKLLHVELEQPFNKPYLSTSVQDFWGRRWNIMVTRILHPTVYKPMVNASSHFIGRKWAPLPAVVATFTVSGLMHELIFYYIKREKKDTWEAWEPCWDSMCFFFIHGVCLALQIAYKKVFEPKRELLPRVVSCILTMVFVVSTGICLFVPALVRCGVFEKARTESIVFVQFVKNIYVQRGHSLHEG
ncbi:putative long-chain-alcohol O-fatty-acyltransferase [Medicago truncatula]|uniref:Putative long-chain-alcohol O-fatty-acyltransferase n=1 Tax=Medicago truncatula TaxID=3880 RepID=A0A396IL34_MEDTR|nr:acyl-CoA--sterol O-acyltransferase 1 [Medicago truncatula]RHN65044.1 putative long-chain-alcohol O-fatty-acyltransferase [Medicago truncatula]